MDSTELTKTIECLHCEKFFDCAGKPRDVLQCIKFEGRKDLEKEKRGYNTYQE